MVPELLPFLCPPFFLSQKHLQRCLCLHHLLHLDLSFVKPLSMCHSPCMTGVWLTRCVSLDCSSASLILGSSFARSRLRNAWTTYSASWARKVMQLWTARSHLIKPTNEFWRFLDYLESTLDDEISPQVQVYDFEDVKKRSDESADELVDRICQLTCHMQIGNGSDATIEFEVQCRLIQAIPDANIELWKELLKVNHDKKVSHLLEISCIYYAIESGAAVMCASKAIHALCQGCQPQKNKPQKCAPTAPIHTPWPWQLSCTECHLQRLFQKRSLVCEMLQFWYCQPTTHYIRWSWEGLPSSTPWKGEESWCGTSQHWGNTPMWWVVHWCSWLWNCRRCSPRKDCGRWCLCLTV